MKQFKKYGNKTNLTAYIRERFEDFQKVGDIVTIGCFGTDPKVVRATLSNIISSTYKYRTRYDKEEDTLLVHIDGFYRNF